jgi:hypothetical protein
MAHPSEGLNRDPLTSTDSTPSTVGEKSSKFTFVIQTKDSGSRRGGDRIGGEAKSSINAHAARFGHAKKRLQKASVVNKNVDQPRTIRPSPAHDVDATTDGTFAQATSDKSYRSNFGKFGAAHMSHPQHEPGKDLRGQQHRGDWSVAYAVTILNKGNSDPFDAYNFNIDAWANRFLDFGKNAVIPAIFRVEEGNAWFPASASSMHWHTSLADLENTGAAFSLMSYYATALTIISRNAETARRALMFKTKAVELLRNHLLAYNMNEILADANTQGLIYRLFRLEILGRDTSAALFHGGMLRSIVNSKVKQGSIDLGFLTLCLYQDNQRSLSTLTRPVFDHKDTISQAFFAMWNRVPTQLVACDGATLGSPDASIVDPELFVVMVEIRLHFQRYAYMQRQANVSASTWFWLMSKNEVLQGRLINRYLDLSTDATSQANDIQLSLAQRLQACICLAAIFMKRVPIDDPAIRGTPLYRGSTTILTRLAKELQTIEATLARHPKLVSCFKHFDRALLWLLYTGAFGTSRPTADRDVHLYFVARLRHQISELTIASWVEMTPIFDAFLFSEVYCAQPDPEQWFQTVLCTDPGSERLHCSWR